jgi:hypothetical protein
MNATVILFDTGTLYNVSKIPIFAYLADASSYVAVFGDGLSQFIAYNTVFALVCIGKAA